MFTPEDLEAAFVKGKEVIGELTKEIPDLPKAKEYDIKGGYLSMSDALKCDRLNAYKYKGTPPSDSRESNGSAEAGIYLEGRIVETLEAGGIPVASRGAKCRSSIHGIPVSGRLDGEVNQETQVLEVKTTESKGFDRNEQFNQPSPWHRPQVELYLRSTLKPQALVLYFCRETERVRVYKVVPDDELWERIKSSIYRISSAERPEALPREQIPLCQWCVYQTKCWAEN